MNAICEKIYSTVDNIVKNYAKRVAREVRYNPSLYLFRFSDMVSQDVKTILRSNHLRGLDEKS